MNGQFFSNSRKYDCHRRNFLFNKREISALGIRSEDLAIFLNYFEDGFYAFFPSSIGYIFLSNSLESLALNSKSACCKAQTALPVSSCYFYCLKFQFQFQQNAACSVL
jgi:hypothetical protein